MVRKKSGRKAVKTGHWKILKERDVFDSGDGRVKVSVQKIRLPDGRTVDDYYQVKFPASVVTAASTTEGKVIFLRQYLHGFRLRGTVLPAGQISDGETPRRAAARELLEETGYVARCWKYCGSIVPHPNQGCGRVYFYAADSAVKIAPPCSGDLEDARVILVHPDDVPAMVRRLRGKMPSGTITALVLSGILCGNNSGKGRRVC